MSEAENENILLGKKREKKDDSNEDQEDINNASKKKQKLDDKNKSQKKEKEKKDDDSSSSSSGSQPKQSLFSGNEKGFTGGLFGDLDNPQKQTSLFGNTEEKPTSLFGNTEGKLFGNLGGDQKQQSGGLFSGGLFDFSQVNKKKEEEEENEGDDNIGKSNSPKHEYNPEKDNNENADGFIKRYTKKLDNALLYDKLRKTFVSKGEGFIIIETQETENAKKKKERFARILYRNNIGGILFQGVLNDQIHKCVTSEKKLKHIVLFIFLEKGNDEKNPLILAQAKIPFSTLDDSNLFTDKYNNAIKYIKNEIDDF